MQPHFFDCIYPCKVAFTFAFDPLSDVDDEISDTWIKVVGAVQGNSKSWNNIHYESGLGKDNDEYLHKVKIARPNDAVFVGDYEAKPYTDENEGNIYVHIKKLSSTAPVDPDPDNPDPDPEPEPVPEPGKKSSGGGGCDAGFAGLALLLAAPLFLRKKH
jgi:Synergist-CTERM protein sorting domain-containing protein